MQTTTFQEAFTEGLIKKHETAIAILEGIKSLQNKIENLRETQEHLRTIFPSVASGIDHDIEIAGMAIERLYKRYALWNQ